MPEFSVLMSIYNKETPLYLDACLESLNIQTIRASEVVLVLDGYVNQSLLNVIERWRDELKIITVPLPKNVGLGLALNEGLKKCAHDLVARMDTDDVCLPMRFEKQLQAFNQNPNISLCGSYINEIECDTGQFIATRYVKESHEEIIKDAIRRNPFNHMSVMFRKKAVMAVGSYQHMLSMEDWYLWLRLLSQGYQGYNIPEALVNARAGKSMMSRRNGLKYISYEANIAKAKARLFPQYTVKAYIYFIFRSIPRVLPKSLLYLVYLLSRKDK